MTPCSRTFFKTVILILTTSLYIASSDSLFCKPYYNRHRIINPETGLSSYKVLCISKDTLGTLWVGTSKGLDRIYEGRVTHYNKIPEARNKEIRFITTDSIGNVWLGVFGGLYLYDYRTDMFKEMSAGTLELHPISSCLTSDGIVFNTEEGFVKYKYATRTIEMEYRENLANYKQFQLVDNNTAIAYVNSEGIYQISFNTGHKELIYSTKPGTIIHDIQIDSNGRIWVAIHNQGIICISKDGKETLAHFPQDGEFLKGYITLDLYETDGLLFVATDGGGVLVLNPDTFKFYTLTDYIGSEVPEHAETVTTIFISENEIWLGTVQHGLVQLTESDIKFLHSSDFGFGKESGVNYSVTCLEEDPYGNIWIGTDGSGISIFNPETETCHQFKSLTREKVVSIMNIDQDWMLVSVYNKGLYKCNIHTGHVSYLPINDYHTNNEMMRRNIVIKLKKKSDDNAFLSTTDVYNLNPRSGKICKTGLSGISNFRIFYADSSYTFAYNPFEICLFDHKTNKTERILSSPTGDIYQAKFINGELFLIKSYSLYKIGLKEYTLEKIPFQYNEKIQSMESDHNGNLWLATRDKIVRLDGVQVDQYTTFEYSDGQHFNEFVPDAILCSNTGDLYFGGYSGLCVIKADNISDKSEDMKLALLSVISDGGKTDCSYVITKGIPTITVPWNYSLLEFNICTVNGDVFKKNQFRYTIRAKNKHTTISSDNHLSLPALAPGSYNIDIAYLSPKDEWIEDKGVMAVHVLAPWWQSFVFTAGIIILLTGGGALAVYLYHRREKIKAARLYRQRKEKLSESKIRFLINISHELRTPLTLIYAPLKRLIEKGRWTDDKQKAELTGILAQTRYMTQLVNMVLDSRKLEEGYGKLNLQPHDLNRWVADTVEEFRTEFENKGISIRFEPDSSISSVNYDEGKFHIILTNILMNAWKYSDSGTTVTVRTSLSEGRVKVSVSDQGIGLDGVDTSAIFDRFVQVHKQSSGFGLGLSYTKLLVEAHPGGTIGAYSNEDKGSTFWFEIPSDIPCETIQMSHDSILAETTDDPVYPGAEDSGGSDDAGTTLDISGYTVLIAEDEPELLRFMKTELESEFKEVYAAADGQQAYETALKMSPSIIISDVMMPRMNGYELCRKIKNVIQVSHIPVILLTAKIEQVSRAEGYKSGADIFLSKPFDIPTLISAIRNTLYSREMIKEKYRSISTVPASVAEDTFSNADEQFILKIDKFIDENISNDSLNAQMIAEYACMGRASFYKKVKEILGIGIMEYVTRKRMALAASLLKSTDMQISEIALKAGYPDNQYFSRAFKQHFGQSPSAYRKDIAK